MARPGVGEHSTVSGDVGGAGVGADTGAETRRGTRECDHQTGIVDELPIVSQDRRPQSIGPDSRTQFPGPLRRDPA